LPSLPILGTFGPAPAVALTWAMLRTLPKRPSADHCGGTGGALVCLPRSRNPPGAQRKWLGCPTSGTAGASSQNDPVTFETTCTRDVLGTQVPSGHRVRSTDRTEEIGVRNNPSPRVADVGRRAISRTPDRSSSRARVLVVLGRAHRSVGCRTLGIPAPGVVDLVPWIDPRPRDGVARLPVPMECVPVRSRSLLDRWGALGTVCRRGRPESRGLARAVLDLLPRCPHRGHPVQLSCGVHPRDLLEGGTVGWPPSSRGLFAPRLGTLGGNSASPATWSERQAYAPASGHPWPATDCHGLLRIPDSEWQGLRTERSDG
jgi:hypothetical protein